MKRVKQISIDVLVDDKTDGCVLAEQIAKDLENEGNIVLGSCFQDDITDCYKRDYPDMLSETAALDSEEMNNQRLITLKDGTDMGGMVIVFKTNAPIEELKALEKISNDIYINGGEPEDVPRWESILKDKGYVFEYIDDCENGCGTATDWLEEEYPEVTEHYLIENQPTI